MIKWFRNCFGRRRNKQPVIANVVVPKIVEEVPQVIEVQPAPPPPLRPLPPVPTMLSPEEFNRRFEAQREDKVWRLNTHPNSATCPFMAMNDPGIFKNRRGWHLHVQGKIG